jgi:hypothetical protein
MGGFIFTNSLVVRKDGCNVLVSFSTSIEYRWAPAQSPGDSRRGQIVNYAHNAVNNAPSQKAPGNADRDRSERWRRVSAVCAWLDRMWLAGS